MVKLDLDSRESSVNTFTGFKEPQLRRRENRYFSFERNKIEEVEEEILMKKEKSSVPFFIAREALQPISSLSFDDPLSSHPLNMKLNSQINSVDIFLEKGILLPISTADPQQSHFNPSSSVSLFSSSLYSSAKSGLKRKKCSMIFPHYFKPFPKYFIRKKKSKKVLAK